MAPGDNRVVPGLAQQAGELFQMAGPRQPLPAITAQVAAAAGAQPPRAVPAALAMADSAGLELAAWPRRREPAATRAGTRVLLESNRQHLTSRRAERELGVTCRSLARTIAYEAAWYRHHGMPPPDLPLAPAPRAHPERLKARRG